MMEWWSSDQPVYSYMCWERVYNCDKCIFVRTSLSCRWCNNVCRSVYSTTLPYWCTLRIWWVSVCDLSMSIIDWQQSASHIVTVARSSLLLIFTLEQVLLYTTCVVVIFIAVMPLQSGRDFVFSMSGQIFCWTNAQSNGEWIAPSGVSLRKIFENYIQNTAFLATLRQWPLV